MKLRTLAFAVLAIVGVAIDVQAQPQIDSAQAIDGGASLTLESGSQIYVFGMATGGAAQSNPFANGLTVPVANASGILSAEIATTASDSNNFPTSTTYHAIAGFGVSNFTYAQGFYGANANPGADIVTIQFTLNAPALVVAIGTASSQQELTFSGLPEFVVDVPYTTSDAVSIGHAYLQAGTYTVQENSAATAAGQTPSYMADLLGIYAFSDQPNAATSSNPQIPLPQLDTVSLLPACINSMQADINGGASPGESVTSISWDWGDGQQTTGYFPQSHIYSSAGTYTVQVTAHYSDGSSASTSQTLTVGLGILSGCDALAISAGQGGTVSYQASVGSGTVSDGSPVTLQLAQADDLLLTATSCYGDEFLSWSPSYGLSGLPNGSPIPTTSPSIGVVVNSSSQISASFSATCSASAAPLLQDNWSGYIVGVQDGNGNWQSGAVSDVKGSWIVPAVQFPTSTESHSSTWIGIGGYQVAGDLVMPPLVQVGTAQGCVNGNPDYYAWWEGVGASLHSLRGQQMIPTNQFPVSPGDKITAEITYTGGAAGGYYIQMLNASKGVSFSVNWNAPFDTRQTAEWVVEDPQKDAAGGLWLMTDFGTNQFSDCYVILNSNEGPINSCGATNIEATMLDAHGNFEAQPSSVSCDGTGFSVTFNPASLDLRGANLQNANLQSENLQGADLAHANLRNANLSSANLQDANLEEAKLVRANLSNANLSGADLIRADLRDSNLQNANFTDANLSGADLRGAITTGAIFTGAITNDFKHFRHQWGEH